MILKRNEKKITKADEFFIYLNFSLSATLFSHDPTKKEGYWWKSQTAIT